MGSRFFRLGLLTLVFVQVACGVKPDVSGYLADMRVLYKIYDECSSAEFAGCLKKKVVVALDRAVKTSDQLVVADGVRFVRDQAVDPGPLVSEKEVEAALPRALDQHDSSLNQMIFDKIIEFFSSHTLQFKLFDGERSPIEGRARRRVLNSLMMLPVLIGGTFVPLAFGALALLAGKALIIAKLALALAAIVGLKKLVGGGGGGESYQVVSVPHHAGHYKRSFEQEDEAHHLAYNAHLNNLQGIR